MKKKTLLSWSSGKDSAWALHLLRQDPATNLLGLFTVMNQKYGRVCMHATRPKLLHQQAEAASLPIQLINFPDPCTNDHSDAIMREFVTQCAAKGIERIAFGDLFLEDIRRYRESQLTGTGIEPVFPLWKIPTDELAEQMLAGGMEAYLSSVDLKKLPARYAGRKLSRELLAEFPAGTDPCGENGEIHTVVVAGPMFRKAIPVRVGETVERGGFAYADIIPMN
ncbi:MAG: ATP-binding protein [Kiritimatiellae bacterium]|nr:ATP-binding protein [Kiritimatiellia bacterium]